MGAKHVKKTRQQHGIKTWQNTINTVRKELQQEHYSSTIYNAVIISFLFHLSFSASLDLQGAVSVFRGGLFHLLCNLYCSVTHVLPSNHL